MHVDVAWTGVEVQPAMAHGRTAVVIDVLRATTTIAALLHAGAKEVRPVTEVEEARRLAVALRKKNDAEAPTPSDDATGKDGANSVLLAGERHGLPPDGFDMGNSPLQFTSDDVRDRTVVLTTTNGTRAIHRVLEADAVYTAAFIHAASVVDRLVRESPRKLLVVCAGTADRFSMDDALMAGLLVNRLSAPGGPATELTDSAQAAKLLFQHFQHDIAKAVRDSSHGGGLANIGLEEDVRFAGSLDRIAVVPKCVVDADGWKLIDVSSSNR